MGDLFGLFGPSRFLEDDMQEAHDAIMPHLSVLLGQRNTFWLHGVQPACVLVPEWYPQRCNGARMLGLPVYYGPVATPTVVSDV